LLEEFLATASSTAEAEYLTFLRKCADLVIITKPAGGLSATSPVDSIKSLTTLLRTQAASYLREAIVDICPKPDVKAAASRNAAWSLRNTAIRVQAPVRLDLGMGGISDIPPYSLERYGNCVNLPVKLNGRFPLEARAKILNHPALQFVSKDLGAKRNFQSALEFEDQPAALRFHKEVVKFLMSHILEIDDTDDLYRLLKGGLHLETHSYLPVGTGLGASSLLLCTLLQTLGGLLQIQITPQMLFGASVYLENVTGIGGGWEDETAVYPGVKLMESYPETPLSPRAKRLNLNDSALHRLRQDLVLVNTGIPKQGQAFFDAMTERYCLRDAQTLQAIERNNDLNRHLADLLVEGDLPGIGQIMASQWENWKILTLGKCTNPTIDRLFEDIAPFAYGGRLNRAGQGGCAMMIAREGKKRDLIQAIRASLGQPVEIYDWEPVL
jgi:fucokinase